MPKFFHERSDAFVYDSSSMFYWPANEGSGTAAYIFKGDGYNLTLSSASWQATGKLNGWKSPYKVYLSNSADENQFDVGASDYFSGSAWINSGSISSYLPFISKVYRVFPTSDSALNVGFAFYFTSTNWYSYIHYGSLTTQYSTASAAHGISFGGTDLNHCAITVNRATGNARYYRNGIYINDSAYTLATNSIDLGNTRAFNIGSTTISSILRDPPTFVTEIFFDKSKQWTDGDVWRIYKNAR